MLHTFTHVYRSDAELLEYMYIYKEKKAKLMHFKSICSKIQQICSAHVNHADKQASVSLSGLFNPVNVWSNSRKEFAHFKQKPHVFGFYSVGKDSVCILRWFHQRFFLFPTHRKCDELISSSQNDIHRLCYFR